MRRRSNLVFAFAAVFLPLLMGANCSSNEVAQSAATTFFNALATTLASSLFAGAGG